MIAVFEKVVIGYFAKLLEFIREVGKIAFFCFTITDLLFRYGTPFKDLVHQVHRVGVRSIATFVYTGAFGGAILAILMYLLFYDYVAQSF